MIAIERNCLYCNNRFIPSEIDIKKGYGRFCSRRCAAKYNYEKGLTKLTFYIGNRKENTNLIEENKICTICGRDYKAKHYNTTHQKYCSKRCRYIGEAREIENKNEVIDLYKLGYSIHQIREKFHISQMAVKYLLIENNFKIRTAQDQRKLMMHLGMGNWRKKVMKPCAICGKPFYPKLNKKYCSVACEYKDKDTIDRMRRNTLKQIENGKLYRSNTYIEKKVKEFLTEQKIEFKHQYLLGYWSYDFFIPKNNLIEIDGNYWHGKPGLYKNLNGTQIKNIQNDKRKTEYAMQKGYTLKRFWESDINNKWEIVKKELLVIANNG